MNGFLRQATAGQSRLIGPFLDDVDFKTPETGLTIANTDIKLRANGTTLANKNSGGAIHQVNGMYSLTWDATDTANIGELYFSVHVAGALIWAGMYFVVEEAVYDALYADTAPGFLRPTVAGRQLSVGTTGGVPVDSVAADAITATSIASGAFTAAKFAAGAFDAVWTVTTRTLTAFSTALAVSVWDVLASAVATASSIGLQIKTNLDAAVSTRSTYAGGPVDSVTGAVGSVTGLTASDVGSIKTTVEGLNNLSAAQVNAEVVDALNVDTYAEPGQGAPAATASVITKLGWVYKMLRNKLDQTATTFQLYADDGTTVDSKATVSSDGTTTTRGEIVSGP